MRIIGVRPTIQQYLITTISCLLCFGCVTSMILHKTESAPVYAQQYHFCPQIILDAGHGGMDGGAVGTNGVVEKEINLSITKKLQDLLQFNGFDVILTRSTDDSIHDPSETSVAGQKRSDMLHRMKIMEEHPNALFISIHQNMFSDSSCNGAQIFFSSNLPQSQRLAQQLQDGFRENLQLNNTREIKEAGDNLYLLYNAQIPAVLVECGFLSNPEECQLLCDETYQKQVAFTIYLSLLDFYSTEKSVIMNGE